jgi:protein-S-isoprenylcysteine O-methyltransferase Ste14
MVASRLPLLARMRRDLRDVGFLRPTTVTAMYLTYGIHAGTSLAALRHQWLPLPLPERAATVAGGAVAAAGTGLCLLGMRRFPGPGQVSGTQNGPLVTGGIYRYSRNPQYLGYVLALTGLATARRSGAALALAGATAAIYAVWVPVEEEHLRSTIGDAYEQYLHKTRRWLGPGR